MKKLALVFAIFIGVLSSCENGLDCLNKGNAEYSGIDEYGVRRGRINPSNAAYYYTRSCDFKEAIGCYNLGLVLEGEFFNNQTKAQEFYKKACNLGYQVACYKIKE